MLKEITSRTLTGSRGRSCLAADDLRDALVTHVKSAGYVGHRETVFVRLPDHLVALGSQALAHPLEVGLSTSVVLGEVAKAGTNFRCVTFRAGDRGMVCAIPASRLARMGTSKVTADGTVYVPAALAARRSSHA